MKQLAQRSAALLALALPSAASTIGQDGGQSLCKFVLDDDGEGGHLDDLGWGDALLIENSHRTWVYYIIWESPQMLEIADVIDIPPFGEALVEFHTSGDAGKVAESEPLPIRTRLIGSSEVSGICIGASGLRVGS